MFFSLMLLFLVILVVVRGITAPFRYGRYLRRGVFSQYDHPCRYGFRRHHRPLGGLLPILVLVALDRMFTRRY